MEVKFSIIAKTENFLILCKVSYYQIVSLIVNTYLLYILSKQYFEVNFL